METIQNFQAGLEMARQRLKQAGTLDDRDDRVVSELARIQHDVAADPREIVATHRAHLRVRRMYGRAKGWKTGPLNIDWTKVIDWIVANWKDIMRVILSIIPLLIL